LSTAPVTPSAPVERRPQRAEVLLDQARAGLRDPSLRAEAMRLDGRVRVPLARPPEAPALLLEAAHAFEPIDSNRARWALLEALDAGVVSLSFTTGTRLEDIARAVLAVPREAEGPPSLVDLLLDGTATLLAWDYATAVPILREATAVLRSGAVSRLISVSKEAWPQAEGSMAMRAVISIEADNTTSIRWYAREVLRLHEDHPSWLDMERQVAGVDRALTDHAPR
jgi:hypothetical protein